MTDVFDRLWRSNSHPCSAVVCRPNGPLYPTALADKLLNLLDQLGVSPKVSGQRGLPMHVTARYVHPRSTCFKCDCPRHCASPGISVAMCFQRCHIVTNRNSDVVPLPINRDLCTSKVLVRSSRSPVAPSDTKACPLVSVPQHAHPLRLSRSHSHLLSFQV